MVKKINFVNIHNVTGCFKTYFLKLNLLFYSQELVRNVFWILKLETMINNLNIISQINYRKKFLLKKYKINLNRVTYSKVNRE